MRGGASLITKPWSSHAFANAEQSCDSNNQLLPRSKIEVRALNFYYGRSQALRNINLDIPERRVTAVIGPSGCGKSTLLRTFNRMYELYPERRVEGRILLDGVDQTWALSKSCADGSAWCFRGRHINVVHPPQMQGD